MTLHDRFPSLVGQPWFELACQAYNDARERDWEWREDQIVDQVVEQAMLLGVADPGGYCWSCETRKLELQHDGECNACTEHFDQQAKDRKRAIVEREQYLASLSPQERAFIEAQETRTVLLFLHGLITRNVQ